MKKINRILFVCILLVIGSQTFAQRFGVQAGVNFAKMSSRDDDENYTDELDHLVGFNAGVNFEMPFGDLLSVEAALIAETKGYKTNNVKARALYIDLPVLAKVGTSFGQIKVFGAAGPFVGMGVTGKFKSDIETEDIEWGSAVDKDYKRMDFGVKFGAGAEFSGINLGIYYALGLQNISTSDNGYKESTRTISISVGYKFGGK